MNLFAWFVSQFKDNRLSKVCQTKLKRKMVKVEEKSAGLELKGKNCRYKVDSFSKIEGDYHE